MFVTNRELAALIQLADRAPKSMAEQVWLEALSQRINATMEQSQEGKDEDDAEES